MELGMEIGRGKRETRSLEGKTEDADGRQDVKVGWKI